MSSSGSRWSCRRSVKRKVAEHMNELYGTDNDKASSTPSTVNAIEIQSPIELPTTTRVSMSQVAKDNFSESDSQCCDSDDFCDILYDIPARDFSSVSSDDEEQYFDVNANNSILERIRIWAIDFEITQVALREILSILSSTYPDFPKDPRTFLNTPKNVLIEPISGGHYYHHGLKNKLEKELKERKLPPNSKIMFQINVDACLCTAAPKLSFGRFLEKLYLLLNQKSSQLAFFLEYQNLNP